jgi:hypothetical protein
MPEFDAVFSNAGVEPAYIDELVVYYMGGYVRFRVNRQIQPKQFLSVENIDKAKIIHIAHSLRKISS